MYISKKYPKSGELYIAAKGVFSFLVGLSLLLAGNFQAEAGDILRGGAGGASPGSASGGGANAAAAAQAAAIAPRAQDILQRTTQAVQAVQSMQAAARSAAITGANNLGSDPNHAGLLLPNVPNGLTAGGLQVAPGVPANLSSPGAGENPALWQGAALPVQSTSGANTMVTIQQQAQQALLSWKTFNIGKQTTLNFDQSAGGANISQWVAFNKINDPTGVPSQILGSIKAGGQVYVINQNGIIFGGASQVDTHTFVASSLPINENLVSRGLLNNPDLQFLFSQLAISAGKNGTPAFNPPAPSTPNGRAGDVTVQPGATISSPTTADHVGGRVALVGPNVTNAGTISTPDGQAILAAGNQVAMKAHPSTDPSLRGLDVYVGLVDSFSGNATNRGLIDAPRADVTITGKNVNQNGAINSTTSVSLNGRIDLLADYNTAVVTPPSGGSLFLSPQASGLVTLGNGSVTRILPELSSAASVVGRQLALPSLFNIQGQDIHFEGTATVMAPGAALPTGANAVIPVDVAGFSLKTGGMLNAGRWIPVGGTPVFSQTSGQIYLDSGATIDVGGSSNVNASVSDNILSAQLRGAELADSPLQLNGSLRGQTVQVDILQTGVYNGQSWVGTPLANVSGYANLVQHTVGELTSNGGTVSLNAGESVVMQPGSTINVSGGWVNYQGGMVNTTRVVSGGHIYDISKATPDLVYDGIFSGFTASHPKWGVIESFGTPLLGGGYYQSGYIQGGEGGSILINTSSVALDGNLIGNTVTGQRQQTGAPNTSAFSLVFQSQNASTLNPYSPSPPNIVFQSGLSLPPAAAFDYSAGYPQPLRSERKGEVVLSPDLVNVGGFGIISIDSSYDSGAPGAIGNSITIPANVNLKATPGGSITLLAANIDIEGRVASPGGKLSFEAFDISPNVVKDLALGGSGTPPTDLTRGQFTLGTTASVDAAGLIVDYRPSSSNPDTNSLVTAGGMVTIKSLSATLNIGSSVDVSGGAFISPTGKASYGNAGSIQIQTGQDINIESVIGGNLALGAELLGYSGNIGGSLSIQSPLVQIGGAASHSETLMLSPEFFSRGGFNNFSIKGLGEATSVLDQYIPGFVIAPGTIIDPVAQSYLLEPDGLGHGGMVLAKSQLPVGSRKPVNLNFGALGVYDNFFKQIAARGDFVMGAGSIIKTDPMGSVTIRAQTAAVLGSISAPGGSININGSGSFLTIIPSIQALPTVDIGPNSVLSTAGTTLLIADSRGYRTGSVLSGGNISISGNIVTEAGSLLDVSGASGILDLVAVKNGPSQTSNPTLLLPSATLIPTVVESNGGSISFAGAQELFTDAKLIGYSGGSSALGGTLTLSSGINLLGATQTPSDVTIMLTQSGPVISTPFYPQGQTAIGNLVVAAGGGTPSGGHFAAQSFNQSGFDVLNLQGTLEFSGAVSIAAPRSVSIASGGVIVGDPFSVSSSLSISAPYVKIGTAFQSPVSSQQAQTPALQAGGLAYFLTPVNGTAVFNVFSDNLIDIGSLSLQNIGKANFVSNNGDIRGDGTLDVAGDVFMRAGQIYPPTQVSFNIVAYDHGGTPGSVTIESAGNRMLPLSAGGQLNIFASTINQGGVVRAPFGIINLGWDGTGSAPTNLFTGDPFVDPLTNAAPPATNTLNLTAGSKSSVSGVNPATGLGITIPYGTNPSGIAWIDPSGADITSLGPPSKAINISAKNVSDQAGSSIDISGGGDLYAYRWVSGLGGTQDILASSTSYAVIPGYQPDFAPVDPVYRNAGLNVGDRVYLNASNGLSAGIYTLLPARYALLSGALLVTPQSGTPPANAAVKTDGSSIVSGYRLNDLGLVQRGKPLSTSFEVASSSVLNGRAQYDNFYANNFYTQNAQTNGLTAPRLPIDSGQLVLAATQSMVVSGMVTSFAPTGARGGLVDINSPQDIIIFGPGGVDPNPGHDLVLSATELSAFGAESLLIGGVRQVNNHTTTVNVTTKNLKVDNTAAAPLYGTDIILVAQSNLTLAPNADIEQKGTISGAVEPLFLNANGNLLRVSADPLAQISRSSVTPSVFTTGMIIGAGAKIAGASVILDSSYSTSLSPAAVLSGKSIVLDSSRISLQLNNPGNLQPNPGLILAGTALQGLETAQSVSLLSYSSIDIYGSDASASQPSLKVRKLALQANEIRGFNSNTVTFDAGDLILDNGTGGAKPGIVLPSGGTLVFNATNIYLGANPVQINPSTWQYIAQSIDQYNSVVLNASGRILFQTTSTAQASGDANASSKFTTTGEGSGGLHTQGDLILTAPMITGASSANITIATDGALTFASPNGNTTQASVGGLGASLTLLGDSITDNSNINLPSGSITLHATSGNLLVGNTTGAKLDVAGTSQIFFDRVKYTSGGKISLLADNGDVELGGGSGDAIITVAALPGGGNAGALSITAPTGSFKQLGNLFILGNGGISGKSGIFSLDAGSLDGNTVSAGSITGVSLGTLNTLLNAGNFTQSQSIRIRSGNLVLDDTTLAQKFSLSADAGAIEVTPAGFINASGQTGGSIALYARNDLILDPGAQLTVAGLKFDNAGKGGDVAIETTNGQIKIGAGVAGAATLDLSVAGTTGGTLHLRAPQVDSSNVPLVVNGSTTPVDLAIDPLGSASIQNASSIVAEGYYAQDALVTGVAAIDDFKSAANSNAAAFMDNWSNIQTRLLYPDNTSLASFFHVRPGEEIDNSKGSLALNSDWDFSGQSWRFGATNPVKNIYTNSTITVGAEPGILTLRALDSITLHGSLSDGFGEGYTLPLDSNGSPELWLAPLLPTFVNGTPQQSWSYRLTSGADFASSDHHHVQSLAALTLAGLAGSLDIGVNNYLNNTNSGITTQAVQGHYQVVRTGSGDIDISSGANVRLLNQFATIYTAGAQVADPTMGNTFQVPVFKTSKAPNGLIYPAQYSSGGGNVSVTAQGNIEHQTLDFGNDSVIADSVKELPMNWLYRRGYVDGTGKFGKSLLDDVASTTWWIDFSNFFEGVGALGGGNVSMIAGQNISNVDAVAPTNARMTKGTTANPLAANQTLVELGGGDVTVQAGNNIDAGVYYVERGQGTLVAGNSIVTNSTRSPSRTQVSPPTVYDSQTWLPTTLFLGKGSFDVSASGNVLLGPVANPFLLPQGVNNSYLYKSYFSTYAQSDSVNVLSLGGSVTLRESTTIQNFGVFNPLQAWLKLELLVSDDALTNANYQPWLTLVESSVAKFPTFSSLMPGSLSAASFSGDINLVGSLTLSPSSRGTVDLAAANSINGLQSNGLGTDKNGSNVREWSSSSINLSDASPDALPGVTTPFAYQTFVLAAFPSTARKSVLINGSKSSTLLNFDSTNQIFNETGSTFGAASVLQNKLALHANINGKPLHEGDALPLYLYARSGDISGLTLFSPKAARVVAGYDLTDIALYVQNISTDDVSVVAAGHDIIAYDNSAPLLLQARTFGNDLQASAYSTSHIVRTISGNSLLDTTITDGQSGDIQISGPGTLEVLAGRNLDLGVAPTNFDGTSINSNGPADGLTSIGNARNPALPFGGSDIIAGSGIGQAAGLDESPLDFKNFIADIVHGPDGISYLSELSAMAGSNIPVPTTVAEFDNLPADQQDNIALDIFYLALRDAGRAHSKTGADYSKGYAAVTALFPGSKWSGDITTQTRDIRTKSGGNISLFAPGGNLTLETIASGNPLAPPGIITEYGGNISIFTHNNVNIGISRIFTLRGGNEIIWSTVGNIAAGSSSKTVQSAPPTRVLVDAQSADVKTDLAGLATGGGIGVLATVTGVAPGDVDLIAPTGTIDAGDAGIRSSGNLNLAASQILNASNIQSGGTTTGAPAAPAAPNIAGLTAASNTSGAANATAADQAAASRQNQASQEEIPSIINVEFIRFGDGSDGQGEQTGNQQRQAETKSPIVAGL